MRTTKVRPQLYAYLGIAEDGELCLYCSTGRLNPIGIRLERGNPLPKSVGWMNPKDEEDNGSTGALRDLQEHFDKEASGKR